MYYHDLNEKLGCLLTLVLAYLNVDRTCAYEDAWLSPRVWDEGVLGRLQGLGLLRFAPDGDAAYLTGEGVREARGILKYLQLAIGPDVGANLWDIRRAMPHLLAEEAASGAGPLTESEVVYALAGVGRHGGLDDGTGRTSAGPAPASYRRDEGDGRAFVLRVELALGGGSRAWRYGGEGLTCWRRVLVPAGFTFLDLHLVIQLVLSWQDRQPFGFLFTSRRRSLLAGEPDACGGIARPASTRRRPVEQEASTLRLNEVLPRTSGLTYCYGADTVWTHAVSLEETRAGAAGLGPRLLDGVGDAPPEGTAGAEEFVRLRNEVYRSGDGYLRALAAAGELGYVPFAHRAARMRLGEFDEARGRWQRRLDELAADKGGESGTGGAPADGDAGHTGDGNDHA